MKKNLILRLLIVPILVTGMLVGCKSYTDINIDPNNPTAESIPYKFLLPAAQGQLARSLVGTFNQTGNTLAGVWINSSGLSPGVVTFYSITSGTFNNDWVAIYSGVLQDLRICQDKAQTAGDANTVAICKILRAMSMQLIVDSWGDAVYTEANKAPAINTPVYNTAQSIYAGLITELDEAIAAIPFNASINANTDVTLPQALDNMAGGKMQLWRKVAFTLKLRMLMRQVSVAGSTAPTQITALINNPNGAAAFLAAGENLNINPGFIAGTTNKMNYLYETYGFAAAGTQTQSFQLAVRANQLAINNLLAKADPRILSLWRATQARPGSINPPPTADTVAIPRPVSASYLFSPGVYFYGYKLGDPGPAAYTSGATITSQVGTKVVNTATEAVPIMTAAESLLLQAEASARGLGGASDATLFAAAVTESFAWHGRTGGEASTYLAQPSVDYASAVTVDDKVAKIIYEKWVTLQGTNGFEIWCEWRRTGIPTGVRRSGRAVTADYPYRFPYPTTERSGNATNVATASGGNDAVETKNIFWVKQNIPVIPY